MRFAALLFLLTSSAFASEPDIKAKIANLAQSYVEWGPGMSTPGASLTYKEVSRDGRKRTYHLVVTGLPKDGSYALLQWPVTMDKPDVMMKPVFIDPSGILLCVKGGNPNSSDDTVNLIMDSIRGEPARNAVISVEDKNLRVLGKITQEPLEATDKNCHLSVTYLTARGEVVFVEGSGLAAGEAFAISMHSGSKEVNEDGKATAAGGFRISFLSPDPKAPSHKGRAELHLKAPSCSPSLDFPWGDLSSE